MSPENEKYTAVKDLHQHLYSTMKLNPRTVQWYVTEGLLPKAEKQGAEAVYPASAHIVERVMTIQVLQRTFELKLREIKAIAQAQIHADWDEIFGLIQVLLDTFPLETLNRRSGLPQRNHTNERICRLVFKWLASGRSVEDISVIEAEHYVDLNYDFNDEECSIADEEEA